MCRGRPRAVGERGTRCVVLAEHTTVIADPEPRCATALVDDGDTVLVGVGDLAAVGGAVDTVEAGRMRDGQRVVRVDRSGDTRRPVPGVGDQCEQVLAVTGEGQPASTDRIAGDVAVGLLPRGRRTGDIDALERPG